MKHLLLILCCCYLTVNGWSQKITYAEPDRDDPRGVNFEIIGKYNNHFIVYKNYRTDNYFTIFDNNMKQVNKIPLEIFPERLLQTDVLAYRDYFYIFYQYQKKNIVYVMAAKFDGNGKQIGNNIELDTTEVNFTANNKLYTFLNSEDKSKIAFVKVNNKRRETYHVTTVVFDKNLELLKRNKLYIKSEDNNNELLSEFAVDNAGTIVFLKEASTQQRDNIATVSLCMLTTATDSLRELKIGLPKIFIDQLKMKVNNSNHQLLVTGFYAKTRRGNIDGIYCLMFDYANTSVISNKTYTFGEEFRNDAKGEATIKTAFNDFYLQNIIARNDGGFAVTAEANYTSTRTGNGFNRWDYTGMYWGNSFYNDWYMWNSPGMLGGGMWGNPFWRGGFPQVTRYYSDNIAILSFDSLGAIEWSNVVRKSQYDDNTESLLGYCMLNTGTEIHFLFNQVERRNQILNDHTITPEGQLTRNPPFKNIDVSYECLPRYGKQVSSRQLIVPTLFRNMVSFAKIEF
jgi:hypothetical protein